MRPRLGFILCLLAALGIHAVILLVPRAAQLEELPVPTVELDLAAIPVVAEESRTITPVLAPRSAPALSAAEAPVGPPAENAPPQTQAEAPLPQAAPEMTPPPSAAEAPPDSAASATPEDLSLPALPAGPDLAPGISQGDYRIAAAAETSAPERDGPRSAPGGTGASGTSSTTGPSGSAPVRPAPALIPPRPRAEILPAYPRSARRAGLEGVVKVVAMIDDSGMVTHAEVAVSSGHPTLDQAALEAVQRAFFAPAVQDGKPVACRIVVPIRFKLSPPG
jgi:protein TonB